MKQRIDGIAVTAGRAAAAALIGTLFAVEVLAMSQMRSRSATAAVEEAFENFARPGAWQPRTAPGTTLAIDRVAGQHGEAMRMTYDFRGSQAYVLATRSVDLDLQGNFQFTFFVRRSNPDNAFEFKLIDAAGNTFMKKWYSFGEVGAWKPVTIRKRDITWAWGPDAGAAISRIRTLELAITGGGQGEVSFDEIQLHPLPADDRLNVDPPAPIGLHPRWLSEEQAYWTLVGVPGDDNEALLCEDGTIEPHKRGFSILPMLMVDGTAVMRNNATITQSLLDDVLPIPSVRWEHDDFFLDIQLFAHGEPGRSVAYAKYSVANRRDSDLACTLKLIVQPYQVYPPWQGGGGISPIYSIAVARGAVKINGTNRIGLPIDPDDVQVCSENRTAGQAALLNDRARWLSSARAELTDPTGFGAACMEFDLELEPGSTSACYLVLPLHDVKPDIKPGCGATEMETIYAARLQETIDLWSDRVSGLPITLPEKAVVDTVKANIAYNLVTQDGPALQPGSRSYDKSWMRDGSMAAYALLQAGRTEEARSFIEWYAGFQQESGEIPPIIDTKASDPLWEEKQNGLVEYDSQGEFIWIIGQYYRFTGDRAFLQRMYEPVVRALRFLETLRQRRLTDEFRDGPPEKRICYGILPESTSHEGYHMKHSYWDDFWGLKGWEEARALAAVAGREDLVPWMDAEYADFHRCVYASLEFAFAFKNIDYIPGCAELGDIDPTSTAAALVYCDQLASMPRKQLERTFDRMTEEFRRRLQPGATYRFTPYEVRNIPALLRLGRKDDALALLRLMLDSRRPEGWNQLAEVVNSNERFPGYIGDMPHTWVGAEFINAVRSLLVYEDGDRLVVGAGIDPAWLEDQQSVGATNLPVHGGHLSFTMRKEGNDIHVDLAGSTSARRITVVPPVPGTPSAVTVNGEPVALLKSGRLEIDTLPAAVTFRYD
jgi:hypothetical protein